MTSASSSGVCLHLLPAEILIIIGQCLPQDGLNPLSRTCKRLHDVLFPLLYEHVLVRTIRGYNCLHQVLSCTSVRPSLIKTLTLKYGQVATSPNYDRWAIDDLHDTPSSPLAPPAPLDEGQTQAWDLASTLPSLSSFSITTPFDDEDEVHRILWYSKAFVMGSRKVFENLKKCSLAYSPQSTLPMMGSRILLMLLPSLEDLTLCGLDLLNLTSRSHLPLATDPSFSSLRPLKRFEIFNCYWKTEDIAEMLKVRQTQELMILSDGQMVRTYRHFWKPVNLVENIVRAAPEIEKLTIRLCCQWLQEDDHEYTMLAHASHLKYIEIDSELLFGDLPSFNEGIWMNPELRFAYRELPLQTMLPSSMEVLIIGWIHIAHDAINWIVTNIVDRRDTDYPRLRTIGVSIDCGWWDYVGLAASINDMQRKCNDRGVEFVKKGLANRSEIEETPSDKQSRVTYEL